MSGANQLVASSESSTSVAGKLHHSRRMRAWVIAAHALMCVLLLAIPIKSFSQSCPTLPASSVWINGGFPGLGEGDATFVCNAYIAYYNGLFGGPNGNATISLTSCPGPALPTGTITSFTFTYDQIPTPHGASQGGMPVYGLFTVVSATSASSCPQYWVIATPPVQADVQCRNCVGDPINPPVGNVYFTEDDVKFEGDGVVGFRRFYNSADITGADAVTGWRHSYDRSINTVYQPSSTNYPGQSATVSPQYSTPASACVTGFAAIQSSVSAWSGATASYSSGVCSVTKASVLIATLPIQSYPDPQPPATPVEYDVIRDDGQTLRYPVNGSTVVNPPGISIRLAVSGSGFTVTDDDDDVEVYNSAGVLQSITSRAGVVQTISYDSNGLFHEAIDSFGHSVTVARNSQGNIGSITASGGGIVSYAYTGNQLTGVTNLDTTTKAYVYGDGRFANALTSIIDENGNTYSSWGYNAQEQATSTSEAGGVNATSLLYNGDANNSVTVTDALGAVRTFSYSRVGDVNKVAGISGSQCPNCEESEATTYDSYGWVASRTDYNGNLTCYANDPTRGLELVRVEGFAPGSTCPASLSSYTPAFGTLQRKITTTWMSAWREPSLITEPNRTTAFTPDSSGNILTKTVTDLTVTPNVSRTWTYTYNSYGQPLTIKGPRGNGFTDLTTIAYWPCPGTYCGQVETIKNQVGQITTFNAYNAYGQPLTITDPNNVVTTLTYDTGYRLHSRQVGSEITYYTYWPTGLLNTVQLPDSSTITYSYDSAHRLHQITDAAGNYVLYSYDLMSNRTGEETFDSSGVAHRNHTRQFNALSQLWKDINAANTASVTTTYLYDSQGNQTNVNAPLSRNTIKYYDALNRLDQITDPNTGNTYLGYDANDNLASVQDPRAFTTSYSHDGFNDLTKVVSPDTGTTLYAYDSEGNPKTITDARGAVASLSFDDANRLTKIVYSDQTIIYGYDSGTYGVGRLTSASDANHSMSWAYDALGRVSGKGQTVASVTKSVGYSYVNGDLITLVTPSSQTITYGYTNHRITSIQVGSTTLLSGVTYDPFGPATGWTWGNGTTTSKSFDLDGNPSQIVTAGVTNSYAVDDASRITQLTDGGLSSNTWNFTAYDLLDRIKTASSSSKSRGYTYDANGNVTGISGTSTSTETVSTTNNQLKSTTGAIARTYSYDTAGNASYTGEQFTFNQRGRMSVAVSSAGTTNYVYNALGQLIEKSGNGGTTLLVYDEAGHILGEYTSAGALIQETIWMGDTPVATLRPNGTSVSIYYVHTDHLGTPRKVTRPSDNGLMWRYDPDTYGASTTAANGNPAGLGTFVYNLRLPGQYFLSESGLSYNYFRTYDPAVGRYIESDPIGLRGGINPYAYASGDPVSNTDPLGLKVAITGITPASQAALQDAYNTVGTTQTGRMLEMALEDSPNEYLITDFFSSKYPANFLYWNNIISINPNFHPALVGRNKCGEMESQSTPTAVVLGHELGHALANPYSEGPSPDKMDNVNQFENPIREELGLPPRIMYAPPLAFKRTP